MQTADHRQGVALVAVERTDGDEVERETCSGRSAARRSLDR
jgi:hypothetical protein